MSFSPSSLRAIPLFSDIPDAQLEALVAAFGRRKLGAGDVLFEEGQLADRLILLVEGEIEVRRGKDRLVVRPVAPVGEVGALASLHRATTATAVVDSQVLVLPTEELVSFFDRHGVIGLQFHRNLLHVLADKLVRDRRRMDEMQANLVEAQKTMKRMREALLPAEDTALHRMMFEELDSIIEHNRRGHYLVDVPRVLTAVLRIDGQPDAQVLRMSNEHIYTGLGPSLAAGAEWSGVLSLSSELELPVSGVIESVGATELCIALDPLIDEYSGALERHLARLQLLDVVL
jgi:CRP-like cAMP-binding protein